MNEQKQNNHTPAGPPEPVQSQAPDPTGPMSSDAPAVNQEPEAEQQPPEAEQQPPEAEQQPPESAPTPGEQEPAKSKTPKKAPPKRRRSVARQDPTRVADYFAGCPRCSFFLAGYRLICQDFEDAAAGAVDDWLDLSWNLAVRNLVGKSYGHAMGEPFEAFQGVCPECMRALTVEPGHDDEESHRFSIQINPRA